MVSVLVAEIKALIEEDEVKIHLCPPLKKIKKKTNENKLNGFRTRAQAVNYKTQLMDCCDFFAVLQL